MNENKRFTVYDDGFSKHIIDNSLTEDKHEGNIYDIYEMCNKLNELNDENEQLKTFLKKNCPMCRCNLKLFYEESKQRGDLDD